MILVEKLGGEEFSAEDERMPILLPAHLSLSCENIKLRSTISKIKQTAKVHTR